MGNEEKRGPGRPRSRPLDLITIDQAVELIKETLLQKYKNKEIAERMTLAKGTIYNLISKKYLRRHGAARCVLLEKDEIIAKLCG